MSKEIVRHMRLCLDCDADLNGRHGHSKRCVPCQEKQEKTMMKKRRKYSSKRCTHSGCELPHRAKGFCQVHYSRQMNGRSMDAAIKIISRRTACSVEGCDRKHYAKAFCSFHYRRWKEKRSLAGMRRELLVGTIRYTEDGYKRIKLRNGERGWMPEHRYVMEQHIGLPLLKHETVHHINGVRDDNRIENLELWSSSHPPGQRVADKIRWAKELLKQYESVRQLEMFN